MNAYHHDRRAFVLGGLAGLAATASGASFAAGYPSRPVRILVTTPAGAGPDAYARMVGESLGEKLGVQVLVENRPSGTGFLAASAAKTYPADGYTILMGVAQQFTINPVIYKSLPYDPVNDFVPLVLSAEYDTLLTVHPDLPVHSVAELVQYIKARPGQLSYASFGINTPSHFAGEAFKRAAGLDLAHVPYNGSPQQVTDLVGGNIKIGFTVWGAIKPFVEAGKLRVLATTSRERRPSMPQVPTMVESGYPDVLATGWYGFFVRSGTPADAVARLTRDLAAVCIEKGIKAKSAEQGIDPVLVQGGDVSRALHEQTEQWRRTALAVGFKAE